MDGMKGLHQIKISIITILLPTYSFLYYEIKNVMNFNNIVKLNYVLYMYTIINNRGNIMQNIYST